MATSTPRRPRTILKSLAVTVGVVAAACGTDPGTLRGGSPPAVPAPGPGDPGRLFLRGPGGVGVLDVGSGELVVSAPAGLVSADRSVVVGAAPSRVGTGTDVVASSPVTGDEVGRVRLDGVFEPRVASADGASVALGPVREPLVGGALAPGRLRTGLAVVRFDGSATRELDVAANVEPEAFTTDGRALIVVDYLPPEAPDRYRVARLDLATGELSELKSPDAVGGVEMQGTARTQALSPDGSRLYTLYSIAPRPVATGAGAGAGAGLGHGRAFVHVLDLREQWAHCIDLPQPFGSAGDSAGGSAFAVSIGADGRQLWVVDSTAQMVAEVDTAALSVTRVDPVAVDGYRPMLAAGAGGDLVYLAGGSSVTALDAASLASRRTWTVDGEVSALGLLDDGRLAVVTGDEALLFAADPVAVEPVLRLPLPPLGPVSSLDPNAVPDQRGEYECAC